MSIKNNFPAVRPSLLVDFRNAETVDPRGVSVRASTATYTDQFGIIRTAADNVPRITFDAVTGECLGLMRELQSTNLFTYSEDFSNVRWIKTNATVTVNTAVAPDATLTMDKAIPANGTTISRISQSYTVASGVTLTFSVYAKKAEKDTIAVWFNDLNILPSAYFGSGTYVNLTTGVVTGSGVTVKNEGNGVYRLFISVTTTASTTGFVAITAGSTGNVNAVVGNGFDGVFNWGAQLEAGSFATSYIPTVASQVTRAADSYTLSGANFTSWYNQLAQGVIVADVVTPVSGIVLTAGGANLRAPVAANRAYGLPFYPTTTTSLTLGVGTHKKISYYPSAVEYRNLITPVNAVASAFVMTVFIDTNGGTFQWPNRTGTRNATINWGDGTSVTSTGDLTAKTYANAGYYDITVTGQYTAPNFANGGDRLKCVDIRQWGSVTGMTAWDGSFFGCANLVGTAVDAPVLIGSLLNMLLGCTVFNGAIGNWNTSAVTGMSQLFNGASAFNQNIGAWNTGAVTNMTGMFGGASAFNQNIGAWNTGAVTNMGYMFYLATAFNQNIGAWNIGAVTSMNNMFGVASAFNQNIGAWNTGAVTNMAGMFDAASSFNQNIGSWNTGAVTTMTVMFSGASAFNNGGSPTINNWNTGSVTNMSTMFNGASSFNQNIGSWNTGNVTAMVNMFNGASAFNNGGSATINNWDVSKVTTMQSLFTNASAFNQNIGSWNTIALTNANSTFFGATLFNNGGSSTINNWNTSSVTIMQSMFNASAFNQNISSWNMGAVTSANSMFQQAAAFNQNLSSRVTGLLVQPTNFSLSANATFANNANGLKPFLAGGVVQINT